MAVLSAAQVKQYAYNAGFRGAALDTIVAIARAESGFNTQAHNPRGRDDSYGLTQINFRASEGLAGRVQQFGLKSAQDAWDPATNMRIAFALSGGGKNFQPWTTYTRGTYKQYLGQARSAPLSGGTSNAGGQMAGDPTALYQKAIKDEQARLAQFKKDLPKQTTAAAKAFMTKAIKDTEAKIASYQKALKTSPAATKARELYGYLGSYLDHPEIGPILLQAAQGQWSKERLQGALSKTNWWKTTGESAREFDALKATDPASAKARIDAVRAQISDAAVGLDVNLSAARLGVIADRAVREGWNESQIRDALAAEARLDPAQATRSSGQQIQKMAAEYAVPLSAQSIAGWSARMIEGSTTEEGFRAYLVNQAKSRFPTIAAALEEGRTVREVADPYLEIAADTLEINPAEIRLNDTKWLAALDMTDEGGKRRMMTLDEWAKRLRQDTQYGYQFTGTARRDATTFASDLARTFGRVA